MIELHQFESLQGHFRRPHLRRLSEPLASVDTRVEHLQDTMKLVFADGLNLAKGHYGARYSVWILVIFGGVPKEQFLIYRTGPSNRWLTADCAPVVTKTMQGHKSGISRLWC